MTNQLQTMAHTQGRMVVRGRYQLNAAEGGELRGQAATPGDARRLAACWNAFEGVTTEGVEVLGASLLFKGTHVAKLATARAALEAANIACTDLANGLRTSMIALAATQEELAGGSGAAGKRGKSWRPPDDRRCKRLCIDRTHPHLPESNSMSAKDGGPAFPGTNAEMTGIDSDGIERWDTEASGGMSLRDYFAASADVLAYKPIEALQVRLGRHPTIGKLASYIAEIRGIEADAMIAERNKP